MTRPGRRRSWPRDSSACSPPAAVTRSRVVISTPSTTTSKTSSAAPTRSARTISTRSVSDAERFSTGSLKPAMRLALAQLNTVVGDLDGNRDKILRALEEAKSANADLVLFPELAVTGYPPEDLLLRPGFVRAAEESLRELARSARGITALVGFPHFDRDLYNACAVCSGGEVKAVHRKRLLPNYGVFDEDRYFAPARDLFLLRLGETLVGPKICEDLWQPGPFATDRARAGAQLLTNISASPFHLCR